MTFFVWVLCRLFIFERFVLIVYLFLKNMLWMPMFIWLMSIDRFEHALFLLWVFQRGLEQLVGWMNQNYLKQLYQRVGRLMGKAVSDDLKYCLDVQCQHVARSCFCLWVGVKGTMGEFLSIVCLLILNQLPRADIKYCLGALIYYFHPTFKASLVIWLILR